MLPQTEVFLEIYGPQLVAFGTALQKTLVRSHADSSVLALPALPPTTLTKAPNLPHPHPGHLQSPLWTHTSSALTAAQPNNTHFALPIYLFCHLYPHKPILPASEALPVLLLYHLAMLISKCFAHCPLEVTHSTHEKTIES